MSSLFKNFIKLDTSGRLYHLPVPVIALTGGIATGKSTVSKYLVKKGYPLIDADLLVKKIYSLQETKDFIKSVAPMVWKSEEIDFPALRILFFGNPKLKESIEKYIFSKLPEIFLERFKELGSPEFIIYDVPLLFEKGIDSLVDLKIVVWAPQKIQLTRLINRDNITEEEAKNILAHQMNIDEKKVLADFVIDNSSGIEELHLNVDMIFSQIIKG